MIETLNFYVIPFGLPFAFQIVVAFALIVVFFILYCFAFPTKRDRVDFLIQPYLLPWTIFLLFYTGLVLLMTCLTGEPWPFGFRILMPFQLVFFIIAPALFYKAFYRLSRLFKSAAIAGLSIYMLLSIIRAISVLGKFHAGLA